jgi:hypothetical protein
VFSGRESEVTGLAPAESITCAMDDSALRTSPLGPAAPSYLRHSRAAHPYVATTLTVLRCPKATLNKSILDLLSGREFGTGSNSLSLNQSLA